MRPRSLELIWIAAGASGHYLDNLCRSWSDALDNFRYTPADPGGRLAGGGRLQRALPQALARIIPGLDDYDVYVAGPAPLANAAEYLLLERGLPPAQLFVNTLEP